MWTVGVARLSTMGCYPTLQNRCGGRGSFIRFWSDGGVRAYRSPVGIDPIVWT